MNPTAGHEAQATDKVDEVVVGRQASAPAAHRVRYHIGSVAKSRSKEARKVTEAGNSEKASPRLGEALSKI